jgi:D-erythro-7,8-dihydroneopterin triphosphate epimerase
MRVGTIGIHRLQVECIIGVNPEERNQVQTIYIDAEIKIDFSQVIKSKDISDSVSYVEIARICAELAQNNRYLLLENLASDILDQFGTLFHPIFAKVKIQKPSAIRSAEYAFIEMERS